MNTLLIFFAFPIAVIIFSIVLEKLLNNPIAVASLIFAVFLILAFTAFDTTFLIATLAYTILSLITALLVQLLCREDDDDDDDDVCSTVEDLLNNNSNNTNSCGCGCNRFRRK